MVVVVAVWPRGLVQEELRKQLQQSLVESDNQRDLCRKLHEMEIQLKQLKSANYSYKAQVPRTLLLRQGAPSLLTLCPKPNFLVGSGSG